MHLDGHKTLAVVLRVLPRQDGNVPIITHSQITADHGLNWRVVHNLDPNGDSERLELNCVANGAEFFWRYDGDESEEGADLFGFLEFFTNHLIAKATQLLVGASV
jgi:hypothetical protein